MDDVVEFDPALAGLWPIGRAVAYDGRLGDQVRAVLLETKSGAASGGPVEEMQGLLNEMTRELRAQFALFRTIRERAGPGLDGDDAEAKVAKADAKAAVDSMALIARTLEKIDDMQRRLADALARQAEEVFDDAAYRALFDDIDRKISERAAERAKMLLEEWAAGAAGGQGPPGTGGERAGPADAAAGGGQD
ncbi:hypothetical protein [Rhizobium sp.]